MSARQLPGGRRRDGPVLSEGRAGAQQELFLATLCWWPGADRGRSGIAFVLIALRRRRCREETAMTATDELLSNARAYADSFEGGELPMPPARRVAVV